MGSIIFVWYQAILVIVNISILMTQNNIIVICLILQYILWLYSPLSPARSQWTVWNSDYLAPPSGLENLFYFIILVHKKLSLFLQVFVRNWVTKYEYLVSLNGENITTQYSLCYYVLSVVFPPPLGADSWTPGFIEFYMWLHIKNEYLHKLKRTASDSESRYWPKCWYFSTGSFKATLCTTLEVCTIKWRF